MSIRLYYDDPYLTEFRATVVHVATEGGSTRVTLDRTAFYPTSGGQPCDLGSIGGCPVADVFERDGEIVHSVESCDGVDLGERVDCRLDAERRFDYMRQHLGQHILSASFEKDLEANTVGFHLGPESVAIDLDIPSLDESRADRVEDLANMVIQQDRPVSAVWLSKEEASRLPLRKIPQRDGPLRVIIVEGFDYSPCGGTHPRRTGEVGMIKILGWERAHAGIRVTFLCGSRALADYRWKNSTIREIARRFSVGPREAGDAVARQRDRLKVMAKELERLSALALRHEAACLVAEISGGSPAGFPIVVARSFTNRPVAEISGLAAAIASMGNAVALLSSSVDGGLKVVFARSQDVREDMNLLMKSTMALFSGRGGGTAWSAQGGIEKCPPDTADRLLSFAQGSISPRP